MSTKTVSLVLMIIGLIVLAVSLLADVIGVGQYPQAIGPIQWLGAALGLIVAVIGIIVFVRQGKTKG